MWGIFCIILLVPLNTAMDLNNVMTVHLLKISIKLGSKIHTYAGMYSELVNGHHM